MAPIANHAELDELLGDWSDTPIQTKKAFLHLKDHLVQKTALQLDFIARPGVSYSLRAKHENQHRRPLFGMIDIIDDDPTRRWLSVCFFGDMISDPKDIGDFVPEGLWGQDAHCFDIEAWDDAAMQYVIDRLDEAYAEASRGMIRQS